MHAIQCSICHFFSGFCSAGSLEIDQITKQEKEKEKYKFLHFSCGIRCLYQILSCFFSLLHVQVAFIFMLSVVPFFVLYYLCCALALLWCLLVEPASTTCGGERRGTKLWSKERFFVILSKSGLSLLFDFFDFFLNTQTHGILFSQRCWCFKTPLDGFSRRWNDQAVLYIRSDQPVFCFGLLIL